MAYLLKTATIRTNNTSEGMKRIGEMWQDVLNGKLPILFNSEHQFQQGISSISKYSNYESDENGDYDLSIMGVTTDFFEQLENAISSGIYKKYNVSGDDLELCTKKAWEVVWNEQQAGAIKRAFSEDYESTIPAQYAKDGKAHCYLYIAVV